VELGRSTRATAALRAWAAGAGWDVDTADVPGVVLGGHRFVACDSGALATLDPGGTAAGFHQPPPFGRLVELPVQPTTEPAALETAELFFGSLGMHAELVGDAPGLVLGRIVAQLVNEAAFALGEGIGSGTDIDAGMTLGLNHPRGPFAWGEEIGADAVLALLTGLHDEDREERYRPAPALVRAARTDAPLDAG
jgi:3-hydroxybutyryl-CoA dehydrogenase